MHRSGTSAFARVLSLCGGALPLRLLPANFGNPTGYWEPRRALELNDRFLHLNGTSWDDTRLTQQVRGPDTDFGRAYVDAIADFLRSGFAPGGPVVLKDPRIASLIPHWMAAANAVGWPVKVVHMVRNPADVAASLAARDGFSAELAFALWLKNNLLAELETRRFPRTIVSYEDLMRDGCQTAERCIDELGLPLAVGEATGAIVDFLAPELRHHRDVAVPPEIMDPTLRGLVDRVYGMLLHRADGAARAAELDAVLAQCIASQPREAPFKKIGQVETLAPRAGAVSLRAKNAKPSPLRARFGTDPVQL
jgi:hypothetical protein